MRLISSDKTVDVPYKQVVLQILEDTRLNLFIIYANKDGNIWRMGSYKTLKDAKDTMDNIQKLYWRYGGNTIYIFPEGSKKNKEYD